MNLPVPVRFQRARTLARLPNGNYNLSPQGVENSYASFLLLL